MQLVAWTWRSHPRYPYRIHSRKPSRSLVKRKAEQMMMVKPVHQRTETSPPQPSHRISGNEHFGFEEYMPDTRTQSIAQGHVVDPDGWTGFPCTESNHLSSFLSVRWQVNDSGALMSSSCLETAWCHHAHSFAGHVHASNSSSPRLLTGKGPQENHRMAWVGRTLWGSPSPTPC